MIFDYLCHRIPERSFFIKNHQFPVCSRCTGYYISIFAYFVFAYFYSIPYSLNSFLIGILLNIPTGIDGLTQFLGYRESNNTLRLITGLLGGLGLAISLMAFKYYTTLWGGF